MRKFISIILVLAVILSLAMPIFAVDETKESKTDCTMEADELFTIINSGNLEALSLADLQEAAKMAETDAQATNIYEEMVDRVISSDDPLTARANYIVDGYVKITDAYQSGSTLTIEYDVLARVPTGAAMFVGYEYPAATRANGGSTSISSKTVGSYTQTYNGVSTIIARQISSSMTARDYQEDHVFKTLYVNSDVYTDYHTVTNAEAISYFVVTVLVPYLSVEIYGDSKPVKYIGKAISFGGVVMALFDALSIDVGVPAPKAGNYFVTQTWYSNNKLYSRIRVWGDKQRYDDRERPSYDSGVYIATTLPDF